MAWTVERLLTASRQKEAALNMVDEETHLRCVVLHSNFRTDLLQQLSFGVSGTQTLVEQPRPSPKPRQASPLASSGHSHQKITEQQRKHELEQERFSISADMNSYCALTWSEAEDSTMGHADRADDQVEDADLLDQSSDDGSDDLFYETSPSPPVDIMLLHEEGDAAVLNSSCHHFPSQPTPRTDRKRRCSVYFDEQESKRPRRDDIAAGGGLLVPFV